MRTHPAPQVGRRALDDAARQARNPGSRQRGSTATEIALGRTERASPGRVSSAAARGRTPGAPCRAPRRRCRATWRVIKFHLGCAGLWEAYRRVRGWAKAVGVSATLLLAGGTIHDVPGRSKAEKFYDDWNQQRRSRWQKS